MYFITDEAIKALKLEAEESATRQEGRKYITDIWADGKAPIFDIEVISDLTVEVPETATALVDRYKRLRQAFKSNDPSDLLVCCGDLVAGRKDKTPQELQRVRDAYTEVCVPAFEQLQEIDQQRHRVPELLTIPGNEDAFSGGGVGHSAWGPASATTAEAEVPPYYSEVAKELAINDLPEKHPEAHPVAAVFRILTEDDSSAPGLLGQVPWAYVAVIGFDSNDVHYKHPLVQNYGQIDDEQLRWSERLVDALRSGVARSIPLYVIALTHHNILPVEDRIVSAPKGENDERWVSFRDQMPDGVDPCQPLLCVTNQFLARNSLSTTANASGFLNHCQEMRASLVLHGNMHQRATTSLVSMPLVAGQPPAEITVLAAPTFAQDHPASGMARIRLDLWKGQAEIAVNYELAPDGQPSAGPVQVVRPLISASRVGAPERRLFDKVHGLVVTALGREDPEHRDEVLAFAKHVAETWERDGYAVLSFPNGVLPHLGPPTRQNHYYLLLLLRETVGGNYEILLSRHSPLRPSEIAEWDTLLMPAFSSVRNLMERLHLDITRQVVTQAEDLERAQTAKGFEEAVNIIQSSGSDLQEDIWLDKLRELDSTNLEKISPTTGEITDYEYRLVVLTPFVRDRQSAGTKPGMTEQQKKQLRAEGDLVGWFNELPSVQTPGAPLHGRQTLPMEAVMADGAGLRWEPSNDDVSSEDTDDEARRRTMLPPGSVWFPLPETDETVGPWELCPSITARNADVMRWVSEQLRSRRSAAGAFPAHIVFGQMREAESFQLVEGPFPFASAHTGGDETAPAVSTLEAMRRVKYDKKYDLACEHPYEESEIKQVVLVRRTIEVGLRRDSNGRKRERDVILVFDATNRLKASDRDLRYFMTCALDWGGELLGLLRPAQRYVLRAGLDRAEWVTNFIAAECKTDPWGFVRATYGGAGEPVSLTPPIVERVQWHDCDSDDEDKIDFVVCDGNHRTVHKVWKNRQPAAAIGVVSEPVQPYYARPFSPYEWDITADNILTVSPDPRFKYAAQRVDLAKLNEQSQKILRGHPEDMLYRRYYRDLGSGFGPVGGQGGRYV